MSDLMLCGVLRTPMPHDPSNLGLIEWAHIKDRMLQAANELEKRTARIEALEAQVRAADALEADIFYLCACVESHAEKFSVPEHMRELIKNIRVAYRAAKGETQ